MRRALAPILIASLAVPVPVPAGAAERTCRTSIAGMVSDLAYDPSEDAVAKNRTLSERAWSMFGNDTCPGYVTLRAMTPELTDAQRGPFCLIYDKEAQTFTGFSQGEGDAYRVCTESKTFCERVNAGTDAALRVAGLSEEPTAEEAAAAAAGGVSTAQRGYEAVRDTAAGATIITGSSATISSALSSAGTAAMAAVTAPAALAAAAVSVVAVGGAVYVCR